MVAGVSNIVALQENQNDRVTAKAYREKKKKKKRNVIARSTNKVSLKNIYYQCVDSCGEVKKKNRFPRSAKKATRDNVEHSLVCRGSE